jgi:hypothetical protein
MTLTGRRKFGDKWYTHYQTYQNSRTAAAKAANARGRGLLARVSHTSQGYELWVRSSEAWGGRMRGSRGRGDGELGGTAVRGILRYATLKAVIEGVHL